MEAHESSLFLSFFKNIGLEYVPGVAPKGSAAYAPKTPLRLLLIKGKRVARISQVPLYASSLTQSNVFVMETPNTIFIYGGKHAGIYDKARGAEFANSLKGSRRLTYIDDEPKNEEFWDHLGGYVDVSMIQVHLVLVLMGSRLKTFQPKLCRPPSVPFKSTQVLHSSFALRALEREVHILSR